MSDKILRDAQERLDIKTRLNENFFVEAGAGSGKTASLVNRMLAYLREGSCTIDQIAAITFTRKAAGELKQRLQIELEKAVSKEQDENAKIRLQQALINLHRCFTGTIHSFCSSLLRERPVEARLNPDFTEIEGLEEVLLERKAWQQYLLDISLNKPDEFAVLGEIDLSPDQLFPVYRTLNLYPEVDKPVQDISFPDLQGVSEILFELLNEAEPFLPSFEPEKGWDSLQLKLRRITRWRRYQQSSNQLVLLRLLTELDRSQAKIVQNRWLSNDGAKEVYAVYDDFYVHYMQPILRQWREYRYKKAMQFLLPACDYYQRTRVRENILNFQDLLLRTEILLRDNPEVRAYFQQKYPRLLVDEFQDTDPLQAEIMLYLTGSDINERDWTLLQPIPGSLFVVGDPKQSIYRFRRADIDTFNQVRQQIVDAGGCVSSLNTNFRTLPVPLDWINQTFDKLFADAASPYQAGYISMHENREEIGSDTGVRVIKLPLNVKGQRKIGPMDDAVRIAAWIRSCLDGGINLSGADDTGEKENFRKAVPEDFMILLKYKKDMPIYTEALEKYGIVYQVSGGSDIKNSDYLQELQYLLQAVIDPGNPLALVSAVKGLFFGINDQILYEYKKAGGSFSFLAEVPDWDQKENRELLVDAFECLKTYRNWTLTLPVSAAIERIINASGLVSAAMTEARGKSQVAYIFQLLEILRAQEQQGKTRLNDAVDLLVTILEEGLEEELDLDGGKINGVRIMNLHKAKGLEAPVVILANPWHESEHPPAYHVRRTGGTSEAFLQMSVPFGEFGREVLAQPPGWNSYCDEETQYQEAESVRLLYVAATRARDLLVICTNPNRPIVNPWYPLEGYLSGTAEIQIPADIEEVNNPINTPGMIPMEEVQMAREDLHDNLLTMAQSSYKRITVTESVKQDVEAPSRQKNGKGQTWGNVIHHALERIAAEPAIIDDDLWLGRLLTQEGRSLDELEFLKEYLSALLASTFWSRAMSGSIILTETPFGVWENGCYLTGTIDLLFKEADGWVLVDYKTDSIIDEQHLQELTDYYSPQLILYKRYWEQISGETVKEVGIFFTDKLEWIKIL